MAPVTKPQRLRWRAPRIRLLIDTTAAKAALKAKRQAAARERQRAYYALWYSRNREKIAAKRAGEVRWAGRPHDPARKAAYDRVYRQTNRERIAAYNKSRPKRRQARPYRPAHTLPPFPDLTRPKTPSKRRSKSRRRSTPSITTALAADPRSAFRMASA
jgi:hypothetical protein